MLAHTNPQQGLVAGRADNGLAQARFVQGAHAIGHGSLAGEYDPRGLVELLGGAANFDIGLGGGGAQGTGN
ncbi:hypothetical protein GCM10027278_36400 [Paralcaligenes ginsengisoli]